MRLRGVGKVFLLPQLPAARPFVEIDTVGDALYTGSRRFRCNHNFRGEAVLMRIDPTVNDLLGEHSHIAPDIGGRQRLPAAD